MRIIGGEWGGRRLVSPKGERTRPTTDAHRESIFNVIHHGLGLEPRRVLDLFSGTGALGFEALSRGALSAVLVENDGGAARAIRQNAESLQVGGDRMHLVTNGTIKDWARLLAATPASFRPFDLIFCDPPYGKNLVERALEVLETSPGLWSPGAWLVAETGSDEAMPKLPVVWQLRKERERSVTRLLFYRRGE